MIARGAVYPEEERLRVVGILHGADAGTLSALERLTGVSRRTLRRWRDYTPAGDPVPTEWRCSCTPYGVRVRTHACPQCGRACAAMPTE